MVEEEEDSRTRTTGTRGIYLKRTATIKIDEQVVNKAINRGLNVSRTCEVFLSSLVREIETKNLDHLSERITQYDVELYFSVKTLVNLESPLMEEEASS